MRRDFACITKQNNHLKGLGMEKLLMVAFAGLIGVGVLIGTASAAYTQSTSAAAPFRVWFTIHPPCQSNPAPHLALGAVAPDPGSTEGSRPALSIQFSPGRAFEISLQPAPLPSSGEGTGNLIGSAAPGDNNELVPLLCAEAASSTAWGTDHGNTISAVGTGMGNTGAQSITKTGYAQAVDVHHPPGISPDTVTVNIYC